MAKKVKKHPLVPVRCTNIPTTRPRMPEACDLPQTLDDWDLAVWMLNHGHIYADLKNKTHEQAIVDHYAKVIRVWMKDLGNAPHKQALATSENVLSESAQDTDDADDMQPRDVGQSAQYSRGSSSIVPCLGCLVLLVNWISPELRRRRHGGGPLVVNPRRLGQAPRGGNR
ncbi:hypothetical protein IMZ48_40695 [Candidatus Bathyarchaeota archaeon]|nr:hypothetical protein [Candidatus Bathyarchaeota archaeon]